MFSCFLGMKRRKNRKRPEKHISSRVNAKLLNGRYVLKEELGFGASATVYLARDILSKKLVAIKRIERGPKITEYVKREVLLHRSLSHHNIIGFREVFLTDTHLCIVLEYANGGDLVDYMNKHGNLTETTAKCIFKQLIDAVRHCHRNGIVNRDIKLENILLTSANDVDTVKLADFGFSKLTMDNPITLLGTLGSAAPEIIQYASRQRPYDGEKVDIWTCGVVLYRLLYGRLPFALPYEETRTWVKSTRLVPSTEAERQRLIEQSRRITQCEVNLPTHRQVGKKMVEVSKSSLDLLTGILCKVKRRWSLKQIGQCEWLRGIDNVAPETPLYPTDLVPCSQTDTEVQQILLEAKSLLGSHPILPPLAVLPTGGGVLLRISEVPSDLSNPTTPEQSGYSFPSQVMTDHSATERSGSATP